MLCPFCPTQRPIPLDSCYCPYCGTSLHDAMSDASDQTLSVGNTPVDAFTPFVAPPSNIAFTLDHYQIVKSIAKGGMGEVFLTYDPVCQREIALKRIRADLQSKETLQQRFLREAHITSHLTHPAIIPIYNIHKEKMDELYYTMPFVEGKTLKQLLRETHRVEKTGEKGDPNTTIPALMRIFLSVCQAVAYAHTRNILHRDLKPENIIIGKYGQVMILDWGLAQFISKEETKQRQTTESSTDTRATNETQLGKVVGTISYMAPERAFGHPATPQTEIYSLGVILYQILTLRYPFRRESLEDFRKQAKKEIFREPSEIAPYRDVPQILTAVTKKCLAYQPKNRYRSVDELIEDVENYLEGRSDWFKRAVISVAKPKHWEFQENVLLAEHLAITRGTEASDWVHLMISKESYGQNVQLKTRIKIHQNGGGVGFLINIPEEAEREHPTEGYCIWLGTKEDPSTKILRSTVVVMQIPELFLEKNIWYSIEIEKNHNNIHISLNGKLACSYVSHLPLTGTHIGLLSRDLHYEIEPISIYLGGQNAVISCLAVPDAFLAHGDYTTALNEYRRIGYTFAGRTEGRDAMFRSGVTLLEQARNSRDHLEAERLFHEALEEFNKLQGTPGAPLGYLGKGLVYRALQNYEEEIKCYELACRRYKNHPLLPILEEQILYRTYESSRKHTSAAYHFILLALRHLPEIDTSSQLDQLTSRLETHWEKLPFFIPVNSLSKTIKIQEFSIQLAFWLAKPHVLEELANETKESSAILHKNAILCLLELGCTKLAKEKYQQQDACSPMFNLLFSLNEDNSAHIVEELLKLSQTCLPVQEHLFLYVLGWLQAKNLSQLVLSLTDALTCYESPEFSLQRDCYKIWALLYLGRWEDAQESLERYSVEQLAQENSLLHFLYGCWLVATEDASIAHIHFSSTLDAPHPHTWMLCAHFLKGFLRKQPNWLKKAFMWEKRKLYQQLTLYFRCAGNPQTADKWASEEKQEYLLEDPFAATATEQPMKRPISD